MTDEQIKQNAEKYAEQNKVNFSEDKNFSVYDYDEQKEAYLAGAHSRDEEVKHIEEKYVFCRKKMIKFNNELDKLRNQWISVKERLPKKVDGRIRSDVVLVTLGRCWTAAEYHFGDKQWINLLGNNILSDTNVIEPEYWQDVNLPEEVLEKGE